MKIEVETLKIRKTPTKQRGTYTYVTAEGQCIVLRPGENDVTEVDIKRLHTMDDAEVYNNLKNARPEPSETEKQQMREWEEQHSGEKAPRNWNQSLDASLTDEDDSATLGDMIATPEKTDSPAVERLREIVATMTERQQQVYQLHLLEGFSVKETAAILGLSSPAVTKHKRRIIEIIKKILQGVNFHPLPFACRESMPTT